MLVSRYISVVSRRILAVEASRSFVLPLLEPLFQITTHMTFEQRLQLFGLASTLPSGWTACEIGSYFGASTAFLAAAASVNGGHVHAVDTWKNDAMGADEPLEDTFARFRENTRAFQHLITAHRGDAAELAGMVPAVDLLFIDGDHSHEATLSNLNDYAPKIKPNGILILHDFHYETVSGAVHDYFPPGRLAHISAVDSLQAFHVRPAG